MYRTLMTNLVSELLVSDSEATVLDSTLGVVSGSTLSSVNVVLHASTDKCYSNLRHYNLSRFTDGRRATIVHRISPENLFTA